jgi:hypothetical protein
MSLDFATEANATLRLVGTAVEEGRMSLALAALTLRQVYTRHHIQISEATTAAVVARWLGDRPGTTPDHPFAVPAGESPTVTRLRTEIALLDLLAKGPLTPGELGRARHARRLMLHHLGHTVEETQAAAL